MSRIAPSEASLRIDIRPASIEDVPVMDMLLKDLADFLGERGTYCRNPEVLKRYGFGDHRLFNTMLAFSGPEPTGICIYFSEFSTWRGEPGVYIQDLYVVPSLRGSGVGLRLITATRDYARSSWDAAYVRLSADRSNLQAIHFYKRLGFEIDQDNLILKLCPSAAPKE